MSKINRKFRDISGFTLIELLVVIGIIAILAAVVIIAINPARQFAQARNTQRWSNVNAILNAIGQNMADNRGVFDCGAALPSTATNMADDGYDIYDCIIPTYISSMPIDPSVGDFTDGTNYSTGYHVVRDATTGRITVTAPEGANETAASASIGVTR
ncbi:MAG: prepilin-type N-terminal cleavage/methylation domain-containing protein [bacterium]|nr:prepilin-type N-terminal cleavage/methylation domain-containing protein [bacterium]